MKKLNKSKMNKIMLAMSIVLGFSSVGQLHADEQNSFKSKLYVGGSAIYSKLKPKIVANNTTVEDDSSAGYKAFVGYKVKPNLAVEGAYYDLGSVKVNRGTNSTKLKYKSFAVQAVGKKAITKKIDLFGKVGIATLKSTMSNDSIKHNTINKTSAVVGIGGEYAIKKRFSVRAEYEYFDKDYQALSLGVAFKSY